MSDTTKAALDQAIRAHVTDEQDGRLCIGWILHAAAINGDDMGNGSTRYLAEYADGQPYHVGLGLAHMMINSYDLQANEEDE